MATDTNRGVPNELEILMGRASVCLKNKEWPEADKYYSRVLERSAQHTLAWVGLLCAELKLSNEEELATVSDPYTLSNHDYFKSAIGCADSETRARLKGYVQTVETRILAARKILSEADYKALLELQESDLESYKQSGEKLRVSIAGIDWIVLDFEGSEVLLLTENALENTRYYNDEFKAVTWAECSLKEYLNSQFLNELGESKEAVIEKPHSNLNNPWFNTSGGEDTEDKVFLLDLREVVEYFGDSGKLNNRQREELYFSDQFDEARIAYNTNSKACWWWLRSSGGNSNYAAVVNDDGAVHVGGHSVYGGTGGVRPALWLNLESEIF